MSDILPINGETNTQAAARVNDAAGWRIAPITFAEAADLLTAATPGGSAQDRAEAVRAGLDSILATIAANPSPSVQAIAQTWLSGQALSIGSAVFRGTLASVLSEEQQQAIAPLLRTAPLVTTDDVAAAITAHAFAQAASARLASLETYASGYRAAVNAATTIDELPEPLSNG